MGDISPNFNRAEFACRCGCGFDSVYPEMLSKLESLREYFGQPVNINCGCRCPAHNKEVNGAEHSQHIEGIAADIVVKQTPPAAVADYLERQYPDAHGIGRYSTFTHFDIRPERARWKG